MRYAGILLFCLSVSVVVADDKQMVNSIGMRLVRIEAGQFVMGQGEARISAFPQPILRPKARFYCLAGSTPLGREL